MKPLLVFVNPKSGGNQVSTAFPPHRALYLGAGVTPTYQSFQRPFQASPLALDLRDPEKSHLCPSPLLGLVPQSHLFPMLLLPTLPRLLPPVPLVSSTTPLGFLSPTGR